jgi:hypothetical protein
LTSLGKTYLDKMAIILPPSELRVFYDMIDRVAQDYLRKKYHHDFLFNE